MYVIIRRFSHVRSPRAAIHRAETGIGFLMKSCPGFRGYYIFDAGAGTIGSVTFFETDQQAHVANEKATLWVKESLADLVDGEPEITQGDVVASVLGDGT